MTSSALASGNQTPLFLLNPPILEKDFRKPLWGSLVTEPYKPTNHFSSFRKTAPSDLVPEIEANPSRIKDYGEIMKWSRRGGAEAVVQSFFKAFLEVGESETEFRKSTSARWHFMTSPEEQLGVLLRNDAWEKDALAFIEKNPEKELFFVAAMLIVQRMQTGKSTGKDAKGGAGGTVINPHDGSKLVSAAAHGEKTADRVVGGTFLEPHILAIGYYPVKITTEDSNGKEKRSLGAKLRKLFGLKPKHRTVGTLYNVDKKILYRLKMGEQMSEGNVQFLDDDESEKDAEGGITPAPTQNGGLSPVVSGSLEEPVREPSLEGVAIYSPKVPAE